MRFVGASAADGVSITGEARDLLIEDCLIEGYQNNVMMEASHGPITNVTLRRNVIVDARPINTNRNSQGIFCEKVKGIRLEQNLLDRNGWAADRNQTIFNHGVYIRANCTGLVATGNIFANASSHGLQARGGGLIEGNLFINNPTGLSFGLVNNSPITPDGVKGRVADNVFIGGRDLHKDPRGNGIELGNIKTGGGTSVENNLFTHGWTRPNFAAIRIASGYNNENVSAAVGINDLTITRNVIYKWSQGFEVVDGLHTGKPGSPWSLVNLKITSNDFQRIAGKLGQFDSDMGPTVQFQDNRYQGDSGDLFSADKRTLTKDDWQKEFEPTAKFMSVAYPDPERSIGNYSQSIGRGTTIDSFLAAARQQSRANWNASLTAAPVRDYFFGGFGMAASTPSPLPPPTTKSPPSPPPPPPPPPEPGNPPAQNPTAKADVAPYHWAKGRQRLHLDVVYAGAKAIEIGSIDPADVQLVGLEGAVAATTADVLQEIGGSVTVRYGFQAPGGKWRKTDATDWELRVNADEVRDANQQAVVSADLGRFQLKVGSEPRPVAVSASLVRKSGEHQLKLSFSHPVPAPGIPSGGITLVGPDGPVAFDFTTQQLAEGKPTRTHFATLSHQPDGKLGRGDYQLQINDNVLFDSFARAIDGDRDGVCGGAFSRTYNV